MLHEFKDEKINITNLKSNSEPSKKYSYPKYKLSTQNFSNSSIQDMSLSLPEIIENSHRNLSNDKMV